MKLTLFILLGTLMYSITSFAHEGHSWETPPSGMNTIGTGHGDIAVASNGEVYVSVEGGEKAGIQVYSAEGKYLRNIANAPSDLHGFIIREEAGIEYIYGAGRLSKEIYKMSLNFGKFWKKTGMKYMGSLPPI